MRASLLLESIEAVYQADKRSICIEGPPGGGKTSIVHAAAERLGVEYIHLHAPTMLVEDFGIPVPTEDNQSFRFVPPHWFPRDPDTKAIICFDDRNQCSSDIQKVMANMMQERELHGWAVPDGVMFISTGNRQSDRAGANRVLGHLRNRESVIEFDVTLKDWSEWAFKNGVKPQIISFLNFRPGLLHEYDPSKEICPTPRGWVEGVSNMLGVVPPEAEMEFFKGAVGEGAAADAAAFFQIERELPDINRLLANPDTAEVPEKLSVRYALVGAISERADESNMDNIVKYLARLPGDFSVLAMSMITGRDRTLGRTAAFTKWAVENKDLLK